MKYQDHPLAELFPLMSEAEIGELADDIRTNGLREQLWLLDGKILDGRNRYRACELAEVAPRVQEYKGKEPLAFVLSKNLHRRHLDAGQRAMVAARISSAKQGQRSDLASPDARFPTDAEAAKQLDVSEPSVERAKTVLRNGTPELIHAVESGEVPVKTAAKVAKLPKAEQRKAVKGGKKGVQQAAKKADTKASDDDDDKPDADPSEAFCEQVGGLCREIDDLVRRVEGLKESPYGKFVHYQSAVASLKGARETLWGGRPTHECPYCKVAEEVQPSCRCCRGLGVCTKSSYRAGEAAVGGRK